MTATHTRSRDQERWVDPTAVAAAAFATTLLALVLPSTVRFVVVPLVILLPGHALTLLLQLPDRAFELPLRVALRAMLTVPLAIATGLLLDAIGLGMERVPFVLAFGGVTIAVALGARLRAEPSGARGDEVSTPREAPTHRRTWIIAAGAGALSLAIVMVGVAMQPEPASEFVEVTLRTDREPGDVVVDNGFVTLEIEVTNPTDGSTRIAVQPETADGAVWDDVAVDLAAGERSTVRLAGPVTDAGCDGRVKVFVSASGVGGLVQLTVPYRAERGLTCSAAAG